MARVTCDADGETAQGAAGGARRARLRRPALLPTQCLWGPSMCPVSGIASFGDLKTHEERKPGGHLGVGGWPPLLQEESLKPRVTAPRES